MDMGIGFAEVLFICTLVLVLFGPKDLPRIIREGVRLMAKVRSFSNKVKREINDMNAALDAKPFIAQDTIINQKKKELRKTFLAARKSISPGEHAEKSKIICGHLMNSEQYKNAGSIVMYLAMGSEVGTKQAIAKMAGAGKRVMLPYCIRDQKSLGIGEIRDIEKDVIIGPNKVPEPRKELRDNFFISDLQLIICPGVAFDSSGGRHGSDLGYYDNFLRGRKWSVPIIGLGFDCQVSKEQLPFSYGDIAMDQIITESGFLIQSPGGPGTETVDAVTPPSNGPTE